MRTSKECLAKATELFELSESSPGEEKVLRLLVGHWLNLSRLAEQQDRLSAELE